MNQLDRNTARALIEAGYMPASEYIRMFSKAAPGRDGGCADTGGYGAQGRPLTLPARFAGGRMDAYRVVYRSRGIALGAKTRPERDLTVLNLRRRG